MIKGQPQPIDTVYQEFGKDLYRLTGEEQTDTILNMIQSDPQANNSTVVSISGSDISSGVGAGTTVTATGSLQGGKKMFDNTAPGFILGVDPKDGFAKFYIGNSTTYLNWDGATLTVKGSISASSIDIPDTVTANSFHVDSSGNAWWGSTSLATSKAKVLNTGVATFAQGTGVLTMVNGSGHTVLNIGSSGSVTMTLTPTDNDYAGILLQNAAGLAMTTRLLEVDTQNSSSSGVAVYVSQAGTGSALSVNAVGSDQTNYVVSVSGSTNLRNLLEISSAFNSNNSNTMFHISHTGASGVNKLMQTDNAGLGTTLQMNVTNNSNASNALFISYAGTGRVVEIDNTYSSNPNIVLYVSTNNTTVAPIGSFGGTVASHFARAMTTSGGGTIWGSDGTTPNGNLSANLGDFCINGPSGHPFWNNNGGTGWTQI